jgi:signal transduction histidine kinase
MAEGTTTAMPVAFFRNLLARAARLPERNIRLTVVLCVVAIGGSFAAAGVLQLRADRMHAYRQAEYFERQRAADLAAYADDSLSRFAGIGLMFANGGLAEEAAAALPGVRGIAVSDASGLKFRRSGEAIDTYSLAPLARGGRYIAGNGRNLILVFKDYDRLVAVSIDPAAIAPKPLLQNAGLVSASGVTLAGDAGEGSVAAAAKNWPLTARVVVRKADAVRSWYGSLPLYLFVILGPALVGGWLAVLFVRQFEQRARAKQSIRALRTTHPAEARLLVRLANAERHAAEGLRAKNEFIAHMSHELRTPLNAIIGFSEVIERGYFGQVGHPKYAEYAHDIGAAGRSLHSKIGDILEYANLEAGRYPLAIVSCDAGAIAEACVNENAGKAFSRRIRLDLAQTPAAMMRADPAGIRRILTSLLANALTVTPEEGGVRVEVATEDNAVVIRVIDGGGGLKPHEIEQIGQPFSRIARNGVSTGTGLGLAIVMELARRMGGAVSLGSTPGRGLCAELRMPKA